MEAGREGREGDSPTGPLVKRATVIVLVAVAFVAATLLTAALESGCDLHTPPPCTDAPWPDPCAAAQRDAGGDAR